MIELPADIREEIVAAARGGVPNEICGVLGGSFGVDESRVRSHYPAENAARNTRTRYRLDPEEQLEIFDQLEARGEEIVGFYHSHPRGPLEPSETDAAWATWPDRSYLIVSLGADGSGDDGGESNGDDDLTGEGDSSADDTRRTRLGSWRWRDGADAKAPDAEVIDGRVSDDKNGSSDRGEFGDEGYFERERIVLE
ncbi:desampylase [Halostagnicola bangensis]